MNKGFYIGLTLFIFLVIIAIFGPMMAPYDVTFADPIRTVEEEDGSYDYITSPEAPSLVFPFGSDFYGYDILTLMLYGAKFTLISCFAIVFVRTFVGLFLGTINAFRRKQKVKWLNLNLLNGIPVVILLIFILYPLSLNSPHEGWLLFFLQVLIIAAVGIFSISSPIENRVRTLLVSDFVQASLASGGSVYHVVKKHVLPNIREILTTLITAEFISVLNLIGQLGIFNIFIGGTIYTNAPPLLHSVTKEWAGLVGQGRWHFFNAQWTLFYPFLGYFIVLLAFHLIARGVELHFQEKSRRVPFV